MSKKMKTTYQEVLQNAKFQAECMKRLGSETAGELRDGLTLQVGQCNFYDCWVNYFDDIDIFQVDVLFIEEIYNMSDMTDSGVKQSEYEKKETLYFETKEQVELFLFDKMKEKNHL